MIAITVKVLEFLLYKLQLFLNLLDLSYAPEITDFINEIAVKLPDKCQDIGWGLGLQEFELKQIATRRAWLAAVY